MHEVKSESEVAQSCPTLSDPMDHSLLGSSIHGILQARVLEWGAIAFSECCVSRPENSITLIVHLPQSSWVTRYIASEQSYFERNLFSEHQVSTVGLKYLVNHIARCALIQSLLCHLESTGKVDLAYFLWALELSEWQTIISFNLKSLTGKSLPLL